MKEEFLNIFSDERNAKQDYIEVNFYTLLIGKKKNQWTEDEAE